MLGSLDCLRVVYLYRDPRDVLNSHYHRMISDSMKYGPFMDFQAMDPEDQLLTCLNGMEHVASHRDGFNYIATIRETADDFVMAIQNENTFAIGFEGIRFAPRETYRRLLDWLGFGDISVIPMLDADLDEVIHLGSFEAQTGGQRLDGDTKEEDFNQSSKYFFASNIRKGEAGGWRENYTPKVKEYVKEQIGEALITLGYEKDLNW